MIMFRSSVQLKNSPIKYGKLKNIYQGENQAYLDKSHKYIYKLFLQAEFSFTPCITNATTVAH